MNYSARLNEHPIFSTVSAAAGRLGIDSYVVGGFVRDMLLDRPSKDIDLVCVGSGIALAREVANALGGVRVNVFQTFGTAQIALPDYDLEFVGARKESYSPDSRKPAVEDGSLEDDQRRRDFTINALALRLSQPEYGQLIDPFGGLADLEKKIIRTPANPDTTFSDDPLRMMRAARFASQLSFDIESAAFQSIQRCTSRLSIISMDRIIAEVNKIILSPTPSYGFRLLFHSGLLHEFFPEMAALQGVEQVGDKAHKDNFYHTLEVLDKVAARSTNLWLRWAAILHDIAKPHTKRFDPLHGWTFHGHEDRGARITPRIFRRLKLPMQANMLYVQKLVRLHLRPIALAQQVSDSAIRRLLFDAGDSIDDLMLLCRADITSKNHQKAARYLKNFDEVERKMSIIEEKDRVRCFQPPISGSEIIDLFGIPPGPLVGLIKERIKNAILDGQIQNSRDEAYTLMLHIAKEKGFELTQK